MQTAPLRVALIGYGYVGKTFHAPLIRATPGLDLALVGSSDAAKVQRDLPGMCVEGGMAAAVSAGDIDLVVIASPNDTHAPLAAAALRAGKHVVVDKPFTLDLAQARELAGLARDTGKLLSVFQNRRWDSDFLALQALLRQGRLGEVVHFESQFDRFRPVVQERWREGDGPGAGIWYDLGPHLVDQALTLFGLPQRVSGHIASQRQGARSPDWAHVVLDYGRRQAVLHASVLVAGGVPRFAVHGTAGSWIKYGLDQQEAQLKAGMQPGAPGWGQDAEPATLYVGDTGVIEPIAVPAGDYGRYYAAVRDAIGHGAANPVTPMQALAVMAVIEAAMASATSGQAQPLALSEAERREAAADWQAQGAIPR